MRLLYCFEPMPRGVIMGKDNTFFVIFTPFATAPSGHIGVPCGKSHIPDDFLGLFIANGAHLFRTFCYLCDC